MNAIEPESFRAGMIEAFNIAIKTQNNCFDNMEGEDLDGFKHWESSMICAGEIAKAIDQHLQKRMTELRSHL